MAILLCSEKFVKSITQVDDNLASGYLGVAIRESQEIYLTQILGSALVSKLQKLIEDNEIDNPENSMYKELLSPVQFYLAYKAMSEVVLLSSVKISNFGPSQSSDDHIRNLDLEETLKYRNILVTKADSYAKLLQQYILENAYAFPEVGECGANAIKAELKSAASTGLFLGGDRGKRVRKGGDCCGNIGSGGHSGGGGEGSVVSWSQDVTGGTKIATITIDGRPTQVFVPEGMTEEQVNALINDAIAVETARTEETYAKENELGNYVTTAETSNFITTADTQNFVTTADTVNFVTTAETANFATTADTQDLDSRVVDLENEILEKQDELIPGSGISIDGNVISCTVSGGSEEQNYRIVDSLSEITDPYDGLAAYTRSGYTTLYGWLFDASQISGDYVAQIYKGGSNITNVYRSGTDFHWGWSNDNTWHTATASNEDFYYKADKDNGLFYLVPVSDINSFTLTLGANASSSETSYSVAFNSSLNIFRGGQWQEINLEKKDYYIQQMTAQERADLVSYFWAHNNAGEMGTLKIGNFHFYFNNCFGKDEFLMPTEYRLARIDSSKALDFTAAVASRSSAVIITSTFRVSENGTIGNEVVREISNS